MSPAAPVPLSQQICNRMELAAGVKLSRGAICVDSLIDLTPTHRHPLWICVCPSVPGSTS